MNSKVNGTLVLIIVVLCIAVGAMGVYIIMNRCSLAPAALEPVAGSNPTPSAALPVEPAVNINEPTPQPADETVGTYTDSTYGWSVSWDTTFFKQVPDPYNQSSLSITHTIPVPYYTEGMGQMMSDTKNPALFFTVLPVGYQDTISSLEAQYSPKFMANVSSSITYGGRQGIKTEMGFEGMGNVDYYLPLTADRTLRVRRNYIDGSVLLGYGQEPTFMTLDEQAQVTDAVLQTLSFEN